MFFSPQIHQKDINRLYLNKDRTLLLTCSKDYTAKLLNADTLEVRVLGMGEGSMLDFMLLWAIIYVHGG